MGDIDLWWSHDEKMDYLVLHVGGLVRTEVARLRRSRKGRQYFLEMDLPNYDIEQIEVGNHTSLPFGEQKQRAEAWVREWFRLAMDSHIE